MPKRKGHPATEEPGEAEPSSSQPKGAGFRNKEKPLVLCSRGITFRFRHLMTDVAQLMPHSKRDSKLDTKSDRGILNEVADLKNCTSVLFFEARKKKDLYLWVAKTPMGPTAKFHVTNIHTMAELKLSGNHLQGSRPCVSFDKMFDEQPHLQLIKEMLGQAFATPRGHKKMKPFFDHVISFSVADNRVWMRNYQVVVPEDKGRPEVDQATLVEVGPRCCLNPIKLFAGSFGGATLYENPTYVSPNEIRSAVKRQKQGKYSKKVKASQRRKQIKEELVMEADPLAYNHAFRD